MTTPSTPDGDILMHTKLTATIGLIAATILTTLAFAATPAAAQVEDTVYTAVTPCAVFDSRTTQGGAGIYAGPYQGDRTPPDSPVSTTKPSKSPAPSLLTKAEATPIA